jgi:hypothetical protein
MQPFKLVVFTTIFLVNVFPTALACKAILQANGRGRKSLERRSRNRKEEFDRKSKGWLALENGIGKAEKDATITVATPSRTYRARRADSEEDSES